MRAYIAAMPGWKRDVGRRLDALIVRTVPGVRKAVKWNSPFYGVEGQGWFLNFHTFTHYVKVAFFRGTTLRPVPPGASKHKEVRYLDIREGDRIDEARLKKWIPAGGRAARLDPVTPIPFRTSHNGRETTLARHRTPGVSTMAGKTSRKSAKVKKAAGRRVASKVKVRAATPRKAAAKSSARTPVKRTTVRRQDDSTSLDSASQAIDRHIRDLADWRGPVLKRMRELIREADPEVVEEWKWKKASSPGTPVWSHDGGVCTGETYKEVVKLTFFRGASLKDPARLFNSSLEGSTRRAIDIHQQDTIEEAAFKELIRDAVAFNVATRRT